MATLRSITTIIGVLTLMTLGFLLYFQDFGSGRGISPGDAPSTIPRNPSSTPSEFTPASVPAASTNTYLGLTLELQLSERSNGRLAVRVDELNTLDIVNNVTAANPVRFPQAILNAYSGCAGVDISDGWTSVLGGPAIFAIFQGDHGSNNYTTDHPLTLYNTTYAETGCPG